MRRFVFAAFALTVLAACQPATTELTEEQKAEIAAEVNALQAEWDAAWVVADYDRAMSYWTQSSETGWATRGWAFLGAEDFVEADDGARAFWRTIARAEVTRSEARTFVLAPNVVYVMERMASIITDTAGVVAPEQSIANTYVWIFQDGEWKIHFAHGSAR